MQTDDILNRDQLIDIHQFLELAAQKHYQGPFQAQMERRIICAADDLETLFLRVREDADYDGFGVRVLDNLGNQVVEGFQCTAYP